MNINELALVRSTRELRIEATPDVVWSILTDVNSWPTWNPAVSRARLDGPFLPGSIFRWKSGGSSIVSTLQEVEQPRRMSWTGKTLGAAAVHVWTLEPVGTGMLVRTSESFEGWLVRLLRSWFQRLLDTTLEEALRSLKAAAETSSRHGSSTV
jgi:hypothetical protein